MMMRHVTILLEAVARGLRAVRPRLREECFPEGGGVSVDSWTPGLKCRFHRHRTGPLPSGLLWTPGAPRGQGPARRTAVNPMAALTQISLGGVAAHHALAVEAAADAGDALLHQPDPARAVVEPQRQHRGLELVVELARMLRGGAAILADRPAGDTFLARLRPPAVEHAQVRDAVQRRLHAAGARGF